MIVADYQQCMFRKFVVILEYYRNYPYCLLLLLLF